MPQSTKPLFNEVEQINSCYYISFTFSTYKANPKEYVRIYSLMLPQHIYSIVCHVQQIPLYSDVVMDFSDTNTLCTNISIGQKLCTIET